MTDTGGHKSNATALHIIRAAAHEFALKPYSLVNLDDILAQAEVTKSAMYSHFRSKHALAIAVVQHRAELAAVAADEMRTPSSSALENLIDTTYLIAVSDISEEMGRAALNLLESVGRFDGFQTTVVEAWVGAVADNVRKAIQEGDVLASTDPVGVGRLIVAMQLGLRQTSSLDQPKTMIGDLEAAWLLLLTGIAEPRRLNYLSAFISRRSALAIRNTAPLGDRTL